MKYVKQPTGLPTRKMSAVILAAFLVNGVIGVLKQFAPEVASVIPGQEYADALAMLIAGYMTKERAT